MGNSNLLSNTSLIPLTNFLSKGFNLGHYGFEPYALHIGGGQLI